MAIGIGASASFSASASLDIGRGGSDGGDAIGSAPLHPFRFLVEFVREPDVQLGFIAFDWLTMGQILSLPLILVGLVLLALSRSAPTLEPAPVAVDPVAKKVR